MSQQNVMPDGTETGELIRCWSYYVHVLILHGPFYTIVESKPELDIPLGKRRIVLST
jgi:hypothetical protein